MSGSKRSREGYLMIDHREAPAVPDSVMVPAGLPQGAGRGMFESATFTCNHCPRIVIMNPLRTRAREYCSGCDSYICDNCGAIRKQTKECKPYKALLDALQESNFQQLEIDKNG